MSKKLADIFNHLSKPQVEAASRLDTVLDTLQAKIDSMKTTDPSKDMIMIQLPLGEMPADKTWDIMIGFEKELAKRYPQVDCMMGGTNSIWGNAIFITLTIGRDNDMAKALKAGLDPRDYNEYYDNVMKRLGEAKGMERFAEKANFDTIHSVLHRVTADGGDANAAGPVRTSIPTSAYSRPHEFFGRYTMWDVDASWPKPALLPQFAHIIPKPKNP